MKKFILLFSFLAIVFLASGVTARAAETEVKNNQDGTITVRYDNSAGDKIKVLIVKSGSQVKYMYDILPGDNSAICALTQGNGTYSVKVCKNISGTKYSVLSSEDVTLNLDNPNEVFLGTSQIVDWDSTNKAIKYASKITKEQKSDLKKIQVVYKYIVENYSYDYEKQKKVSGSAGYIPDIDSVFTKKKGICYDIAALNASMLRSLGIETKLIMGYSTKPELKGVYHAWNKVYNVGSKTWKVMDLTYDVSKYDKVNYKAMEKAEKYYKNESYVY